jgi:hypothetical protein
MYIRFCAGRCAVSAIISGRASGWIGFSCSSTGVKAVDQVFAGIGPVSSNRWPRIASAGSL